MSAHLALRKATHAAHERVDAGYAALNLVDRADYGQFLWHHAKGFVSVEAALTAAGAGALIDDWESLKRGHLLIEDLADLRIDPPSPAAPPLFATPADVLGGAYVIEGSRLGGAMLRRSVPTNFPKKFLDSVQPAGRWRAITRLLDQLLDDPQSLARATISALETFALFERKELDDHLA